MATRTCTRTWAASILRPSGPDPGLLIARPKPRRDFNPASHRRYTISTTCRHFGTGIKPATSVRFRLSKPEHGRIRRAPIRDLHDAPSRPHRAFIALGSNLGDRVAMIDKACKTMELDGSIRILRTSSLWETKAMYVVDQDKFVNGICEIETSLSPIELLDKLQFIEKKMGRIKVIDKGPRNIDLDIILYDDITYSDERLTIPHALMLERDFVLRPLCELIPERRPPSTKSNSRSNARPATFTNYLNRLIKSPAGQPAFTLTPLAPLIPPLSANSPTRKTMIMAIFNRTPDSFSDGGLFFDAGPETITDWVKDAIRKGTTIIDVGGQSTRPNAQEVSAKEEEARVIPVIKLIRSMPQSRDVVISVDTFQASVAKAAIRAGADIVNDVSAGQRDPDMLSTVADLGCTICLMHMRGNAHTMSSKTSYPDGLIQTVGRELLHQVRAAEAAGIRRWRIILDPGIGFSKYTEQNLELIRRLGDLREFPGLEGLPWLVGTSRKAFIGQITGATDMNDRVWGTAATVTAAVQGGADIVRVHDYQQMAKVVKMADAIWRVGGRINTSGSG